MNGFIERKSLVLICGKQMVSDIIQFDMLREGYRVFPFPGQESDIAAARRRRPDAIIIDSAGVEPLVAEFCHEFRKDGEPIPLVILADLKSGLKVEFPDLEHMEILEKPFQMKTLKAKTQELILRTSSFLDRGIHLPEGSEITISAEEYQVFKRGEPIPLSQTEYELFVFLVSHPGQVYSRVSLMERVWNYTSTGNDLRMVDVAIRRLRAKIEDDPAHPCLILTKRGAGYYFGLNRKTEV